MTKTQPAGIYCLMPTHLVQRIHSCIKGEPDVGHMRARAVIREMLAYLKEQEMIDECSQLQLERQLKPASQKDHDHSRRSD